MSNREESEIDIYSEQKDSKIYMYLDTLGNFDKSKLTKRKERLIRYQINKLSKLYEWILINDASVLFQISIYIYQMYHVMYDI